MSHDNDPLSSQSPIHAHATSHRWWNPSTPECTLIKAYMSSTLPLAEVVDRLATPIETLYTSGDHGHLYDGQELVARHQRPLFDPAHALELWGLPVHSAAPDPATYPAGTTEGMLWRLYDSVWVLARGIPAEDAATQGKLIALLAALKARPNPPEPEPLTVAMQRNWVWEPGALWSSQIVIGISLSEHWDYEPANLHFGTGEISRQTWTNVNAFVARVCVAGVMDAFPRGMWALRYLLGNGRVRGHWESLKVEMVDARVPAVLAWIQVAGREIWKKCVQLGREHEAVGPETAEEEVPWNWADKEEMFSVARWRYWKGQWGLLAQNVVFAEETRCCAIVAADLMDQIEKEA